MRSARRVLTRSDRNERAASGALSLCAVCGGAGCGAAFTAGADGVTPKMLKNMPKSGYKLMRVILNDSLGTGCVPAVLKRETIVPLLKAGKQKNQVSSYRPVALTSAI